MVTRQSARLAFTTRGKEIDARSCPIQAALIGEHSEIFLITSRSIVRLRSGDHRTPAKPHTDATPEKASGEGSGPCQIDGTVRDAACCDDPSSCHETATTALGRNQPLVLHA